MANTPHHEVMVENILAVYRRATTEQREAGRQWYPQAGKIVTKIANIFDVETDKVARCLAALSPRNPWRWNVADTLNYVEAFVNNEAMPSATTFERNREAAWRALDGTEPWASVAPKVRSFVNAIHGDGYAVVVDVWALRVATGHSVRAENVRGIYDAVAAAYTTAALMVHEVPRDLQAIVWIVAKDEAVVGMHANTFKAGTAEAVKEMFGES